MENSNKTRTNRIACYAVVLILAAAALYSLVSDRVILYDFCHEYTVSNRSLTDSTDAAFKAVEKDFGGTLQKTFLCDIDSAVTYFMTRDVNSKQVILGDDKWLFFRSTVDENDGTIGDFTGKREYGSKTLSDMTEHLLEAERYFNDRGTDFAVILCPNKSSVYPEFMPKKYIHSEYNDFDRLREELLNAGINTVALKDLFDEKLKAGLPLYYKYDTHWNQAGAYAAVSETLRQAGYEVPDISEMQTDIHPIKGAYHIGAVEDMANMTGLRDVIFDDDVECVLVNTPNTDWEEYEEKYESGQIYQSVNENALYDRSVLVIGDSFMAATMPAFGYVFKKVYAIGSAECSAGKIENIDADMAVFINVERNLLNINKIEWSKQNVGID